MSADSVRRLGVYRLYGSLSLLYIDGCNPLLHIGCTVTTVFLAWIDKFCKETNSCVFERTHDCLLSLSGQLFFRY